MANETMDYGALVKDTFNTFVKQDNLVPLLVGALLLMVGFAFFFIPGLPLLVGFAGMCMRIARGEKVQINEIWPGTDKAIGGVIGGLLFGFGVFVGLIAFIIGAVVVGFFLCLWPYLMVAQNLSAVDALKGSFQLVKANAVHVLVVSAIGWGISMCAGMVPVVGGIFGFAFSSLLTATLFNRLTGPAKEATASAF